MEKEAVSNEILSKIYPETFHTISGRANGVGKAWGVGDDWVCNCSDCAKIRRQIWERLEGGFKN